VAEFDTAQLISKVRSRTHAAASAAGVTDADILDFTYDDLLARLVPLLLRKRGEFLGAQTTVAITAGQSSYRIPSRAVGVKLRDVVLIYSDNTEKPLVLIDPTQAANYAGATPFEPNGYYIQGNSIVLVPAPPTTPTYSLRLRWYQRPNKPVVTSAVGVISAINTGAKTVTLNAGKPAAFLTSVTFDLVQANPPFDGLGIDLVVTNIDVSVPAAPVFTFSAALPADLAVGDYLCLARQAPVLQIPPEAYPLAITYAELRTLGAQNRWKAYEAAADRAKAEEKELKTTLRPRVEGEPKRQVPQFLRRGVFRW
jgi:hypothetical protein